MHGMSGPTEGTLYPIEASWTVAHGQYLPLHCPAGASNSTAAASDLEMCRCEAVPICQHPGEAGDRQAGDLVQGVGHADGGRHDAPQEAAQGHDVRAVHLVAQHSADRRAERLHMCVATQLQPGQHHAEPASG